ncbi:MAG: DNA translocase FtsK 4TM domain-containing protein, partial [Planctomycetaceae bacterium]
MDSPCKDAPLAIVDRAAARSFTTAARPTPAGDAAADPFRAPRDRVRDVTALVLLAACVFLVAALVTFHPADPPLPRGYPVHARAVNACGILGAASAAALFCWFGLGAWFIAALLAGLDYAILRRRKLADLPLRAAGAVVATAGICTLLALFLPDWVDRPLWGPGGRLGALGRHVAEMWFAQAGAAIVVVAITAAGLFLACDAAVLRVLAAGVAAARFVFAACVGLGGRLAAMRSRPVAGDDDGTVDAATMFPGLRGRPGTRTGITADDDADEDDDEPTIRVRRREPPVSTVDEADAEDDVDGDVADEGDDEEPAVAAASRPAVPIRSLASRRKGPEPLALSPEPPGDYELPSLDLLLPTEYLELAEQEQEVRDRAKVLEKTFAEFGFKVKVVEVETGPVISQYEIELEAGLRLSKITNLADDLAIALRVPSVR